ncbi:MAG: protoporphyrinogen oxidase, partial [Opitutaceae bacterium]
MKGSRAIAVLGGGITGLTAAYRIGQLGHRVRVFEENSRLGGAIRTERSDGWLVESGPNSFQLSGADLPQFLHELDLDQEIVEPAALAKNRYIARGQSLVPVPGSPGALLFGSFFSFGAKLRIFRELLQRESRSETDVSVAEFTRRHFGQEVLERAVQPF